MPKKTPFVPKYKQVCEDLAQRIQRGEFPDGARLPRERELCERYQVKRVTVRRALEMLDQSGLAEKRPGLGTYVRTGRSAAASTRGNTMVFAMRRNQNDIRHNVNAFNAMLFFLLEQACHERGLRLQYAGIEDGMAQTDQVSDDVLGVLLVSQHEAEAAESLWKRGIPTICVNHWDERAVSLLPDNFCGMRLAVDHLNRLGHTRVGFIRGPLANVNAEERVMGYRYGMHEHNLPVLDGDIAPGHWTMESGREAMLHLMEQPDRPTAVIAASDMMAIGAIDAAHKLGLSVPGDVSIMGFDNIDMGMYCAPPLTTIGINAPALARLAVDTMLTVASSPEHAQDRYVLRLPADLNTRLSTGPKKQTP